MKFGFVFSQADGRPIYQQLMEQITQRIAVGDWPPNTALPSVRELAADTGVSIITIKRAYLELAREGVIVTQQGKGSWVSDAIDVHRLQRGELLQHLEQAARLAKSLALPREKIIAMLNDFLD